MSDLRRHRLLHAETRTQAWSDWAYAAHGAIELSNSQGFEHTYFMREAAASGLGIGIASYALVELDLRSGRFVAPFGFVPSGRSYCVLHAGRRADNPKVAAFRTWIVDATG